jgi:hypothetical protein
VIETAPLLPDPHHHHDHARQPVITRRWQWLTVLGNAVVGAAELVTGSLTTLAVTADGLHNAGDTAAYYMQAENVLNASMLERQRERLRKIAHWVIAATSLGVGAKAGVDLAYGQEHAGHTAALYTAGASLALNGAMLGRLRRGMRQKGQGASVHERDLAKHFWAVDIPSAALAVAGAALQKYSGSLEQVLACISGAVGAYAFRPTRANLAHNCLDHGQAYNRPAVPPQKSWMARVAYRPRHSIRPERPANVRRLMGLGTAALMLCGLSSAVAPEAPEGASPLAIAPSVPEPAPLLPPALPPQPAAITECVVVAPGDSQWRLVARQTQRATGGQPGTATLNALTVFTAQANKAVFPNPHRLRPGVCLQVPTTATITVLRAAVENGSGNPAVVAAARHLNSYGSFDQALGMDGHFSSLQAGLRQPGATT